MGSRIGCLMLHGFMGSPGSSRPMAQHLASQGVTVHCPLLPGHGHFPDKMHRVSSRAWLAEVEEALDTIRRLCDDIFLIGHSMGAVLSAHIALKNQDLRGLIMLAPIYEVPDWRLSVMPFLRYVLPWLYPHKMKSMRDLVRQRVHDFDPTVDIDDPANLKWLVEATRMPTSALAEMVRTVRSGRKLWPRLNAPVLIFQGGKDPAVSLNAARKVFHAISSERKQFVMFPEAGHELMRPFEPVHTEVWRGIVHFVQTHARVGRQQPA